VRVRVRNIAFVALFVAALVLLILNMLVLTYWR
jgi:hypothetical protein